MLRPRLEGEGGGREFVEERYWQYSATLYQKQGICMYHLQYLPLCIPLSIPRAPAILISISISSHPSIARRRSSFYSTPLHR